MEFEKLSPLVLYLHTVSRTNHVLVVMATQISKIGRSASHLPITCLVSAPNTHYILMCVIQRSLLKLSFSLLEYLRLFGYNPLLECQRYWLQAEENPISLVQIRLVNIVYKLCFVYK